VTISAPDETDAMPHCRFPRAGAFARCRSLVDGEHYGVALIQCDDISTLAVRCALRHDELSAREVLAGFRQQDRHLQRKNMLAIEILMQTVVVTGTVFEDQRRRPRLASPMTSCKKRIEFVRVLHFDT